MAIPVQVPQSQGRDWIACDRVSRIRNRQDWVKVDDVAGSAGGGPACREQYKHQQPVRACTRNGSRYSRFSMRCSNHWMARACWSADAETDSTGRTWRSATLAQGSVLSASSGRSDDGRPAGTNDFQLPRNVKWEYSYPWRMLESIWRLLQR